MTSDWVDDFGHNVTDAGPASIVQYIIGDGSPDRSTLRLKHYAKDAVAFKLNASEREWVEGTRIFMSAGVVTYIGDAPEQFKSQNV